jgi:signal transduction histidine kinase
LGCGLGLTISKYLAEAIGGDIYVESVIQKERERVNKFLRNKGYLAVFPP